MDWIALLLIGLALGWALELILDVLYWGPKNRVLSDNLMICNDKLKSSQRIAASLKADVATLNDQMISLNQQVASLKAERDQISNSLEEVDQWVETSMRQHLFDADMPENKQNRDDKQMPSVARNTINIAKSHLDRTAGQLKGMVSTAREKLRQPQLTSWWKKSYCTVWTWMGAIRKNAHAPQDCSINVK